MDTLTASGENDMDIVLWLDMKRQGYCKLGSPALWSTVKLHTGVSVVAEYPGVIYEMDNEFPDDLTLSDNFKVAGQVIVSGNLKAWLQEKLPDHAIEFLKVSILNHKGRLASDDYYILHPLGLCDCIDVDRSQVSWHPIRKEAILDCEGLVLKKDAIPPKLKLFRPRYWGSNIMATRELANELSQAGFSGLRFIDAEGFNGIG